MKTRFAVLFALLVVAVLFVPNPTFVNRALAQGPQPGIWVSAPVIPGSSRAVRDLPVAAKRIPNGPVPVNPRGQSFVTPGNRPGIQDPLIAQSRAARATSTTPLPSLNFDGLAFVDGGSGDPPDPNGDVGPNNFVIMVNSLFAIYNKSGTKLAGPTSINQIWNVPQFQTHPCFTQNHGDPIVKYDQLADRWLFSQFNWENKAAGPWYLCVAISQTSDPTGPYWLYAFQTLEFPDWPKYGVWPDAYYVGINVNTTAVEYAFDRTKMLAGQLARMIRAAGATNVMLPSHLGGSNPPPLGAPNYYYTMKQDGSGLEVREFHVDWNTPANSTFGNLVTIPVAPFNYTVCGPFVWNCIPQLGTAQKIDPGSDWPLPPLYYRNFGAYESLVGSFVVGVGTPGAGNQAAIRWFELRKTGGNSWSLYQEGTFAPDATTSRFYSSIAMDQKGNIALGYTAGNSSMYPTQRYVTRLASDPLNTLGNEVDLIASSQPQTNSERWEDYASMSVDPSDGCTFWYVGEYIQTSAAGWRTRVGAFQIPSCTQSQANYNLYLPLIVR